MSEPCKCLNSHADITPIHSGHCCFLPADSTCHQAEVEQWNEDQNRLLPEREDRS